MIAIGVSQPAAASDVVVELNNAERVLSTVTGGGYSSLCQTFSDTLCWGKSFVADPEQFQELIKITATFNDPAAKLQSLEIKLNSLQTDITAGFSDLHASVHDIERQLHQENYLEVINAARTANVPGAPFSSLQDAETFLSASDENMTLVKTIFTNRQDTLKIMESNKKQKKKPTPLPSRHLLEFTFTSEVLDSLADWDKFRCIQQLKKKNFNDDTLLTVLHSIDPSDHTRRSS